MTKLSFQIKPGHSLGPFQLGVPIAKILEILESLGKDIKRAEIEFNPQKLTDFLSIKLIYDGIQLHFDPIQQTLQLITIYDIASAYVTLFDKELCARGHQPTYSQVCQTLVVFSESQVGEYSIIHSPGLSFFFKNPNAQEQTEIDATIEAEKIEIHAIEDTEIPVDLPPEVLAVVGEGIDVLGSKITFRSTAQDVLADLGTPDSIFTKKPTADKLRLFNKEESVPLIADYFYNYFGIGIDILFDGVKHNVKKIILHTNYPVHCFFTKYRCCNFKLLLGQEQVQYNAHPQKPQVFQEELVQGLPSAQNRPFNSHHVDRGVITNTSTFNTISQLLPSPSTPLNVQSHEIDVFGPTKLYGYNGFTIEYTKEGFIASVCLFPVKKI